MSGLTAAIMLAAVWVSPAAAQSGDSVAGLPNTYIVQEGDTLWEISQAFLGDPYYWPRLWSVNSQITNPHWIYPGNAIYFRMGDDLNPPRVGTNGSSPPVPPDPVISAAPYVCGPDVRFTEEWGSDVYDAPGFLSHREDVEVYGTVHRASSNFSNLSEGDLLYLRVEDPDAFECGDVVSVFRPVRRKVHHPDSKKQKFGTLYAVMGEAVVVHRYGDYVSARIRDGLAEVQRGDLVGPATPFRITVDVEQPDGDLDGTIVERLNYEQLLTSDRAVVFIDRGRADGVRQGDSFYVTRQVDEYLKDEDSDLPPSVVGRVVVLRVDEYASTAVVTDSSRSIRIGDRITQEVD